MKIVVTGANGFIGSYLCKYLLSKGHDVVGISRKFHESVKKALSLAELLEYDVLSPEFLNLRLDADTIIHLASSNDILSKDYKAGIKLSVEGTVNTLEFAKSNNINNFLFFSTLQVYGSELTGLFDENSKLVPNNDYSINHIYAEIYCEMYSRKTSINVVVIRPSNIFGSFISKDIDRWTLVPGCLCKEFVDNKTITIMSSGNQTRNFISLEQLSYMTLKISENIHKRFDVVNLISNNYMSIKDVANTICCVLKDDYNISMTPSIGSDLPLHPNEFTFDSSILANYNIDFGYSNSLSNLNTEISNLFKILDLNVR